MAEEPADDHLRRTVKKELRKRMRAVRNTIPASSIASRSEKVVANLMALPMWAPSRSVALFWPIEGRHEIDLRPLFAEALRSGKQVYLPWTDADVTPPRLLLRHVDDPSTLAERGYGYEEPRSEAKGASAGDVDLLIVPALAVDLRGHRLGYGAGYYDRLLPELCPPATSVVVAFAFQVLFEVPITEGDVASRWIVTDEAVSEAVSEAMWGATGPSTTSTTSIELPASMSRPSEPGVRVIERPRRIETGGGGS